jgi:hypothetical protein
MAGPVVSLGETPKKVYRIMSWHYGVPLTSPRKKENNFLVLIVGTTGIQVGFAVEGHGARFWQGQ